VHAAADATGQQHRDEQDKVPLHQPEVTKTTLCKVVISPQISQPEIYNTYSNLVPFFTILLLHSVSRK